MNLFYIPNLDQSQTQIQLSEEESKHACKVLRLDVGHELNIMNGSGYHFVGEIIDNHPKRCVVKIDSFTYEEPSSKKIHIAISPTKNLERIEWFIEKSTELGISEISLILSKNSERKQVKEERLEKIMVAASKQSLRKYLPILNPLVSFEEFIQTHKTGAIAHCYQGNKMNLQNNIQKDKYPILIGPEGDFAKSEVELALKSGYDPITLGKTRLRTETAGIYACMLAKTILE